MIRANSLRDMRKKLAASTDQFAYRLGITQSSALRLEQAEERGGITIKKLREAAEALGCELSYELRLKTPLAKKASGSVSPVVVAERKRSFVSEQHREQDVALAKKLTPTNRLRRAFELSDFARELAKCSN